MTCRRLSRLRAAVAGVLTLVGSTCGAQAQAKLTAHYTLSLAGLSIGEGDLSADIDKTQYTARSSGRFFGMWRLLIGDNLAAMAHGASAQGRLAPASYQANFAWDDAVNNVEMSFHDGTVSRFEATPQSPAAPNYIPVAPGDLRGVADPLTAGLVPIPGNGEMVTPAACRRVLPIFDGSHRFDIALSYKRLEAVNLQAGYRGSAVVCGATYRPIAGYIPGSFRVQYLQRSHGMEIALAPITGTRVLGALRISLQTTLGAAVLEATRFESTGR